MAIFYSNKLITKKLKQEAKYLIIRKIDFKKYN